MVSKPSWFKHRRTGAARQVKEREWAYVAFPDGSIIDAAAGKEMKGSINGSGYRLLHTGQPVHVLVAEQLIPNEEGKPFVDHINGWKCDNRVQNLRWVTPKENAANYQEHKLNSFEYKVLFEHFSRHGCRQQMDSHLRKGSLDHSQAGALQTSLSATCQYQSQSKRIACVA